jgi:CrcB protein
LGTTFPYGTVFINATGSFILSFFIAVASRGLLADDTWRWLIAIGFCGGYTTFSTFSYESLVLLHAKKYRSALLFNHFGSYLLGMLAALAGWLLGK